MYDRAAVYDSENNNTTKILDLDACLSNDNYQIKRRMKDVKLDEESDGPVLFQKLNTTRSNIPSQERHEVQNRNAMLPPSCMMMMQAEAEQRSTLSISTNDDEEDNMPKEAHVQATSVKNSSISTTRSSQGACLDRGLTAAAQHNTDARLSTLTLGKGLFYVYFYFISI